MKITIAHLYYDLLNLCGECGNIRILKKFLEEQGIDVEVKFLTVNEQLNFDEYDFVYIGMGINENLLVANNHLKNYKEEIRKAIENNKYFLCTGNSYELFGNKINDTDSLGIFDFNSYYLEDKETMEVDAENELIDKNIIGFINKTSKNDNKNNTFLKIKTEDGTFDEGIKYNNFIGTYTLGPILVRNPIILKKLVEDLIFSKNKDYPIKPFNLQTFEKAYDDCIIRRQKNNQD